MVDRFRVSTQLARKLDELGVPPEGVLRRARLPTELLEQDRILVSTEELFALYRGIAEVSDDPAIGLKLGTESRVERYDPIAITALSARSLRDALARLARYKQLTCPEKLLVTERGEECRVQFRWLLVEETEPAVLIDVCFAWVVGIARRATGDLVQPKRLELRGRATGLRGRPLFLPGVPRLGGELSRRMARASHAGELTAPPQEREFGNSGREFGDTIRIKPSAPGFRPPIRPSLHGKLACGIVRAPVR